MAILTPPAWIADRLDRAFHAMASEAADEYWHRAPAGRPVVQRIGIADIRDALTRGMSDLGANRTDVLFLCVFYPVVGLLLARFASGGGMIPLLFPLASGFALVGPFAGVGLNEMSRLRELGVETRWFHVFHVLRSPSLGPIMLLGLCLAGLFVAWQAAANLIYRATLGPDYPVSIAAFLQDVFFTGPGWTMIVVGILVGFLFAVIVLTISAVSFPLLLDRNAGLAIAVKTSMRVFAMNPGPMLVWGIIISAGLAIGSAPLLLGLVVVLPVLGHTTWHLYRKLVVWVPETDGRG